MKCELAASLTLLCLGIAAEARAQPAQPTWTRFHFDPSTARAELQGYVGTGWKDGWKPICAVECTGMINPALAYRVRMADATEHRLSFSRQARFLDVRVDTSATRSRDNGRFWLTAGGVIAGIGAAAFTPGIAMDPPVDASGESNERSAGDSLALSGAVLVGAGGLVALLALPWALQSGEPAVRVSTEP